MSLPQGSLETINALALRTNDALEHLPDWPALERLADVQIVGNASLESIPAYATTNVEVTFELGSFPGFGSDDNPDVLKPRQFVMFEVGGNPKLTSVAVPAGLERGQYIGIYDNPSLASANLSSVAELDQLSIRNNAVLASVPPETFVNVASFTRVISDNADDGP